jgi:hypothetical protein
MIQTKEWHVLKILIISLMPFIAFWGLLEWLFSLFEIRLAAGFISALLSIHAIVAILLYADFRASLRGKLPLITIRTLLKKSLTIAFVGDTVALSLLGILFYTFNIGFESMLLWSPVFLNLFLFLALQKCLPDSIKRQIKFRQKSLPVKSVFSDTMEEHISQPLSLDMAEPLGLMNPNSPNYIYRSDQQH